MAIVSEKFQLAWYRTLILATVALSMIFLWAYLRIPQANVLVVVFAFLSSVKISGICCLEIRLRILLGLLASSIFLQYIISISHNLQFLNVLLPASASWLILRLLPASSAYIALLTGFLSYSALPGVYAATGRIIDMLLAGLVALLVSSIAPKNQISKIENTDSKLSIEKSFIVSLSIFCAAFLYKLLAMPQGIWIVLTIIFIYMTQKPEEPAVSLVRQRIFSVPAGILLGGLYSGTAVMSDYRLAYLAPLIGAIGFFMLYYQHDFFSFSLFFMFAFTVCADWFSGSLRDFHFLQFMFARTLATVIGAAVLLVIERTAARLYRRSVP